MRIWNALTALVYNALNNSFYNNFFSLISFLYQWALGSAPSFFVDVLDASNLAGTYANGTLGVGATLTKASAGAFPTIDGVTPQLGMVVLLTAQTTATQNGLYTITNLGSSSVAWVLTRYSVTVGTQSVTWNASANMVNGSLFLVKSGTTYGGKVWAYTGPNSPTVGTTALTFVADALLRSATNGTATSYAPVDLVSTSDLAGAYAAGVLTVTAAGATTIDSVTLTLGMRVLLQTQTTTTEQGIYVVTVAGAGGVHTVLTRATDQEQSSQFINGATVIVKAGTVYTATQWIMTFTAPFTLDTSTATFTEFATAVTLAAINNANTTGAQVFPHAGWPQVNNAADTFHTTVGSVATANRATNFPDIAGTLAITGQTTSATAPAFTGTAATAALNPTALVTGTGMTAAGQVMTSTDNHNSTLNQYAGCWLICAGHGPYLIASNTAVAGGVSPLVLTIAVQAPTTDAGAYAIYAGATPVGTVASHTHTNG